MVGTKVQQCLQWSRRVDTKSFLDHIVKIGYLLACLIRGGILGHNNAYMIVRAQQRNLLLSWLSAIVITLSNKTHSLAYHQSSCQSQTAVSPGCQD